MSSGMRSSKEGSNFYAVVKGRSPGIYTVYEEALIAIGGKGKLTSYSSLSDAAASMKNMNYIPHFAIPGNLSIDAAEIRAFGKLKSLAEEESFILKLRTRQDDRARGTSLNDQSRDPSNHVLRQSNRLVRERGSPDGSPANDENMDSPVSLENHMKEGHTLLRPTSMKIPTATWGQIVAGEVPSNNADTRLIRPQFYLSEKTLAKIRTLAQEEIPDFGGFGLDLVGNQIENLEGNMNTFLGESLEELDAAIHKSNGHFLVLAPIYGGGKGQRTEAEVISIIEKALLHERFNSMTVITVGNRGVDYLPYHDFAHYQSVLNYSALIKNIQSSQLYRTNLVTKETEQLLSRDGASSFPLNFHFLFQQQAGGDSGYIVSSNTRYGKYRRIEPSEALPQLTPGADRYTAIGGQWKTLNAFGQDLIKKGVTVCKTFTSSGEAQLIIENEKLNLKPDQALDLGMWLIPIHEYFVKQGETILGIQKKGTTIPMIIKSPALKKYGRFIQSAGGCRISVVIESKDIQEFVRDATTQGMHVFSTSGRLFPNRNFQSDAGYTVLPSSLGDIEIPSVPFAIKKEEITSVIEPITKDVEWVAARGSSPFNYSLLGIVKQTHKLSLECIEDIRQALEPFGLFLICDC